MYINSLPAVVIEMKTTYEYTYKGNINWGNAFTRRVKSYENKHLLYGQNLPTIISAWNKATHKLYGFRNESMHYYSSHK